MNATQKHTMGFGPLCLPTLETAEEAARITDPEERYAFQQRIGRACRLLRAEMQILMRSEGGLREAGPTLDRCWRDAGGVGPAPQVVL